MNDKCMRCGTRFDPSLTDSGVFCNPCEDKGAGFAMHTRRAISERRKSIEKQIRRPVVFPKPKRARTSQDAAAR